ncbi:MAG: SurA N-terminal domain-containing protein [Thermodesulfobacterium sp.]|nr:SurA N-terminal domain-containing protein [Thermodesulfobacterium sp.]
MLRSLRKGATSLYVKLFLVIIVVVFVFWGIGNFASGRKNLVAKVNGIPITLKEFYEYYNFQVSRLKQTFGEISAKDLAKLKLKEQVLEDLIRIKLLEKQAEKFKIKITPVEITYAISQISSFQENGKFSIQKYQYILRELGISPEFFEKLIKSDLIYQRLKLLLTTPVLISEEEIKEYLKYNKQILEILETDLPLKGCIKKVVFSEKDLENYYLAHRDMYKEEEKVKLVYLFFPYKGKAEISEKEIKEYYEKNIERFRIPLRVKLKRIFIPGDHPEAFKKAQTIKSRLKSLSDFSKFGATESNWFEESAFPEAIRDIIKTSHPKEIIGPIKVTSGYLILGVEDIQPERILKLDEVRAEIRKFLEKEKLVKKVKEKVDKIYTEVIKANGLSIWTKENNIKLKETKWLTRKELSRKFNNFKLAQNIFNAPKGEFFSPVETLEGILLIELKDKKPERTLSFKEVKQKVKKDFLNDKGKEICEGKAQQLIKELKNKNLRENMLILKKYNTKEFRIKRYELSQNFSPAIYQKLINVGKKGLIEKPFWDGKVLKIFYIKNIIPFEGKIEEREISEIALKLLKEKREIWFNTWYQLLRKKARVKIYPVFERL